MYEGYTVYGPYRSKEDGRLRVVLTCDGHKLTISYPKYLMELKLDRYLESNELVHHKDKNFENNDYDNLEILIHSQHLRLHNPDGIGNNIKQEPELFICPQCEKLFELSGKQLSSYKSNLKKKYNYQGPFCSRNCAGK